VRAWEEKRRWGRVREPVTDPRCAYDGSRVDLRSMKVMTDRGMQRVDVRGVLDIWADSDPFEQLEVVVLHFDGTLTTQVLVEVEAEPVFRGCSMPVRAPRVR
jgi:hypothetical protein